LKARWLTHVQDCIEASQDSPYSTEAPRMDPYNRPLYTHPGASSARPDPNDYYNYQHQHHGGYPDVHGQHHRYYGDAGTHHGSMDHWAQSNHGGSPVTTLPGNYWRPMHATSPTMPHHDGVPGYPHSPLSPTSQAGLEEESLSPTSEDVDSKAGSANRYARDCRWSERMTDLGGSKKYKCPVSGCESAFARKADKDRHYECVHNRAQNKKYQCSESNCNRKGDSGFTRLDHLREHLRNFHHQNIPKRPKTTYRKSGQE